MLQTPVLPAIFYIGHKKQKSGYPRIGNYDLRVIVMRHGERIDQVLGPNWYKSPQAHAQVPKNMPKRPNSLLYVFDPPITREGERLAMLRGKQLATLGAAADYCYSSPSSRTVITASNLLIGMNRASVPIKIDPILFETMSWNPHLKMLGNISPFMSTKDWSTAGYNIDRRYHRLATYLNPNETEYEYYHRSELFLRSIERRYGSGRSRKNILVVGHASSTEIFPIIAGRYKFDGNRFGHNLTNMPFLHTVILERDAYSKIWSVKPVNI